MITLKQLFDNVWFVTSHLSKKARTTGMIIFSGAMAVAVIFIGVNGFTGSIKAAHGPSYEVEEEGDAVIEEKEQMTEEVTVEDYLQYHVEWIRANYESAKAVKDRDTKATLTKEEDTEKNLKASSNISEQETPILSVEDYTALIRIVEAEATDEDLKGKILIANVVMNRVNIERFPNSIYEVVHQKYNGRAQFSPIDDGRYYSVPITNSTEEAVAAALSGTDYSDGALFFVAKSLASESAGSWFDRNLQFIMKYGVHSFYKY